MTMGVVACLQASAGGSEYRIGPGTSPLQWTDVATLEGDELSALRDLGREYVGPQASVGVGTIATFTDSAPFGETVLERRVKRLSVPAVMVERSGDDAHCVVDLSLAFDDVTGQLLLAFTSARSEWVLPDGTPRIRSRVSLCVPKSHRLEQVPSSPP